MKNTSLFKKGLIDGIPIFLGYLAVSFAFGIQAADIDLSPFQAGLLSLLNVTSAGQFAGLTVIASSGSYIELAILQLIVNLRYLLMSAALSQKLPGDTSTVHRMGIAYGVTDEIFALGGGAGSALGTGGMKTKLTAARLCNEKGVDAVIANGENPEILYDIAAGKQGGYTKFFA
jgi:predicted branched-subunit amino acid permease